MGFLEWLNDVKRSKRVSSTYDDDVLSLYTYSEGGIRYFKTVKYVSPLLEVDGDNNVYLTQTYENFNLNDYVLNKSIYIVKPKPLENINYPFVFDFNFHEKIFHFCFSSGEETIFSLFSGPMLHSYSMRYGTYSLDGELIALPNVNEKGGQHFLCKNNKYETNVNNLDPEQIRWCSGMHWMDGANWDLKYKQSKINGSSLYLASDDRTKIRYLWVFDFETTGLDPDSNEILEIGLNIYEIGYNTFYNQHVNFSCIRKVVVPKEVEELTHITQEMSDTLGLDDVTINQKLKELLKIYGKDAIFSSYNLYFDASFFLAYCEKNNIEIDFDWLDILTIVKDRYDYPHKLGEVISRVINNKREYSELDIEALKECANSHRALDDAIAAFHLLRAMKFVFDDFAKYIGVIGHNPKYPFKMNRYICKIVNNNKGRAKGKIITKVQFFKKEYPIYINMPYDNKLYLKQHKYADDEIYDDFNDIDIKLKFDRRQK